MANSKFFNRSYHLKLIDGLSGKETSIDSLDIKFKTKQVMNCESYDCQIDILGLTPEHINALTETANLSSPEAVDKLRKRIVLTAGYAGNESSIFEGFIIYATVDSPPQMWCHIKASSYFEDVHTIYNISTGPNLSLRELFDYCAKQMGMTPLNKTTIPVMQMAGTFSVVETKTGVLKQLQAMMPNSIIFTHGGILYAYDKQTRPSDRVQILDRENGLLGVDGLDLNLGDFRSWLSDNYPLSEYIDVRSELFPVANGLYRIFCKEYVGHFLGKEWYIIYHTWRFREEEK